MEKTRTEPGGPDGGVAEGSAQANGGADPGQELTALPAAAAPSPVAPVRSGGRLRSLARALLWPLRRFFDPRFGGLSEHVSAESHATREHIAALTADQHNVQLVEQSKQLEDFSRFVVAGRDANIDAATFVGEALRDLEDRISELDRTIRPVSGGPLTMGDAISDLDAGAARFLDHAAGHTGFAAQRGLWFNWPIALTYTPQDVRLYSVNERIVEVPYVLRATAGLEPGARILDVGAAESTLALSLASLGYEVVALDPRGYPLTHPKLRAESSPIEAWETAEPFDAVLCVSTIEHIGAGDYGDEPGPEGADERALRKIHELTKPGGMLVLTAPLGRDGYERSRLEELLESWDVTDFTVSEQTTPTTWLTGEGGPAPTSVALVTATRRD